MITVNKTTKYTYTITNYKNEQFTVIPRSIEDYAQMNKYEACYGLGQRNNNPNHPRIPKIGDKVKLDTQCFKKELCAFNGATGFIVEEVKDTSFFVFQLGKSKFLIQASDIQWYYD